MKYLLNGNDIVGADYGRVIYNENKILLKDFPEPLVYNAIDLGLPSGTLWADRNVGATAPEENGLFFQWGDTIGYTVEQVGTGEGKKYFAWGDYRFSGEGAIDNNPQLKKYCDNTRYGQNNTFVDSKSVLDLEDDAARANMNGVWLMPTEEQISELLNNTRPETVYVNDYRVCRLHSTKDTSKYIDIPVLVMGAASNGSLNGSYTGFFWSNAITTEYCYDAKCFVVGAGPHTSLGEWSRSAGLPVRGVIKK